VAAAAEAEVQVGLAVAALSAMTVLVAQEYTPKSAEPVKTNLLVQVVGVVMVCLTLQLELLVDTVI
jgi:hypothetical protein